MHVRVRGVYSTAITKILLDNGVSISHTSKKIRERFSLPENREPPTVTIKDTDQKHGIVIVGEYEHGKRVYEVIRDSIKDCFCWVSKLPLHSIIKGRVIEVKEGKSIVELKPYTWEQIKEILFYRAEESLYPNTYDDDSISFIAEITLNSPGHMRTGIELLRQSAMIAESKGHEKIEIEDIREANREEWMSDIESLDDDETILLLAVATACKNKAYVSVEDIKETLQIKQEEYGMKIENFDRTFQSLLQQGFVYEGNRGYTILDCPTSILIEEIEKKLRR